MAKQKVDPEENWGEFIVGMQAVIERIAHKFTDDVGLREDSVQVALMNLLKKKPSQCQAYEPYKRGEITYEEWISALDIYLRQCAKNKILSNLHSPTHGDWRTGRTIIKTDPETGKKYKVSVGARYSSFDDLHADYGLDVNDEGEPTWPKSSPATSPEAGGFKQSSDGWGQWTWDNDA